MGLQQKKSVYFLVVTETERYSKNTTPQRFCSIENLVEAFSANRAPLWKTEVSFAQSFVFAHSSNEATAYNEPCTRSRAYTVTHIYRNPGKVSKKCKNMCLALA